MFIIEKNKEGKTVGESALDNQALEIHSSDLTPYGIVISARILHMVSKQASHVAQTHSGTICENSGIDYVRFYSAVSKNDKLFCKIAVNRVWGSTIEVGVKVLAEDFRLIEQKDVLTAYFLFEAKDEEGNLADIPEVIPESDAEKRRYVYAETRRQQRRKL